MTKMVLLTFTALLAIGGVAAAADLPTHKAPPPAPLPTAFSWAGFYIGGDVGGAWGDSTHTFSNGAPTSHSDPSGIIGGGYAGYNFQWSQLVLGVEGDIDAANVSGSFDNTSGATASGGAKFDWEGAVRARAGYAWDRALIYLAGGVAFTDFNYQGGPAPLPACCGYNSSRAGLTIGPGIEYALTDHLIARVEYRYEDFGTARGGLPPTFPTVNMAVTNRYNEVRAGVAYKF